jgi:cytochrome c peroxidase
MADRCENPKIREARSLSSKVFQSKTFSDLLTSNARGETRAFPIYLPMKASLYLLAIIMTSCNVFQAERDSLVTIKTIYVVSIDSLKNSASDLILMIEQKNHTEAVKAFNKARTFYKRGEFLTEYYFPAVAKAMNGPALDKLEEDDAKVIEASGFQVIEEMLFPAFDSAQYNELVDACRILSSTVKRLEEVTKTTEFSKENVFEATRLGLLRLVTLGLSGFDSPIQKNSIAEARESLNGIESTLLSFSADLSPEERTICSYITTEFYFCQKELSKPVSFDEFDRAYFITRFFNPLCKRILDYQKSLGIENNPWPSALNRSSENFFAENAWNPQYFAPGDGRENDKHMKELGKVLFNDPILSGNNARTCASCHKPSNAFADNLDQSLAFNLQGKIKRNTPSLINCALQQAQFWDGRVSFIEDQISQVLHNPDEMHGRLDQSTEMISRSPEYISMFTEAFRDSSRDIVNETNIRIAIAAYVRSLTSLNSKFDGYMRGNYDALSEDEINGFNLFMGKAKCGTCHFMPLFNGSVPPFYKETESEVLGVPATAVKTKAEIDDDKGRFHLFPHGLLEGMFKTPTVRNAALTAPYMHNGIFNTLEDVLDFYNEGGGAGIGVDIQNQTLPPEKLNLSVTEQKQIIAFIHALTDTTNLTSIPSRLPMLGSEKLNARRIGGTY